MRECKGRKDKKGSQIKNIWRKMEVKNRQRKMERRTMSMKIKNKMNSKYLHSLSPSPSSSRDVGCDVTRLHPHPTTLTHTIQHTSHTPPHLPDSHDSISDEDKQDNKGLHEGRHGILAFLEARQHLGTNGLMSEVTEN